MLDLQAPTIAGINHRVRYQLQLSLSCETKQLGSQISSRLLTERSQLEPDKAFH
jgi:hypothetical protein